MTISNTIIFFPLFIWIYSVPACSKIADEPDLKEIYLADPSVFIYKGKYYLYGTGTPGIEKPGAGFIAFQSSDRKTWTGPAGPKDGFVLSRGDSFGDKGFWAPQVFRYKGKFYMFYTANEQIAAAVSDSPLGPFTGKTMQALDAPVKQIDPFVFFDDDGRKYLYHVRLTGGNRIFVAELNDDLLSIKPETLRECISGTEKWENTADAEWPVTEGPTVLKHNGIYYLIYSANDFRNPDYAVSFATSGSPSGPWNKYPGGPFLHRSVLGVNGTGHGDVFTIKNRIYYVFHTHFSDQKVTPRRTALAELRFVKDSLTGTDKIAVVKESFHFPKYKAR